MALVAASALWKCFIIFHHLAGSILFLLFVDLHEFVMNIIWPIYRSRFSAMAYIFHTERTHVDCQQRTHTCPLSFSFQMHSRQFLTTEHLRNTLGNHNSVRLSSVTLIIATINRICTNGTLVV